MCFYAKNSALFDKREILRLLLFFLVEIRASCNFFNVDCQTTGHFSRSAFPKFSALLLSWRICRAELAKLTSPAQRFWEGWVHVGSYLGTERQGQGVKLCNNGSRPSNDDRITYRGYGPRLTGLVQYGHSVTGAKICANTFNTGN